MMRIRKSESGQIAVLSAIFISLFLLGFAALVVDVGFLYSTRRNMQTVADAAAIAGVNALQNKDQCDSGSCLAAQDLAKLNGYTNGINGVTVAAVVPPTVVPSPSTGTYVEVDVSQPVPTFFLRALGFSTVNVGAKAVAGFSPPANCIVTLAGLNPPPLPNGNNALVVSGGSILSAPNCNVVVDSSSTSGLVVNGSLTAGSVGVAAASEGQANSGVTPPYVANTPVVSDPYLSLAAPSQCNSGGGCTVSAANCSAGTFTTQFKSTVSQTINPGVYCGGINVQSGTLTLNPGTYILIGGNALNVSSNSATIKGTGVTFYNTYPTGNPGQYKNINIKGGGSAVLSAPAKNAAVGIPGILFFQDRTAALPASGSNQQETISGGGNVQLQGAVYFPNSPIVISGGSSTTPDNVTIVSYMLTISGGSTYVGGGSSGTTETTGITTTKLYE